MSACPREVIPLLKDVNSFCYNVASVREYILTQKNFSGGEKLRKSRLVLALLVGTVMAGGICGITACSDTPEVPDTPESDVVRNFVPVTKTAWGADV